MSITPRLKKVVDRYPSIPYVVPFFLFLILTVVQAHVPGGLGVGYPLKTVVVAAVLLGLRPWFPQATVRSIWTPLGVGMLVWVIWILPEGRYPLLGNPEPFDPFANFGTKAALVWIGFRLLGATVIVAVAEELFWRGFLIRWLVSADFRGVPAGTFTWSSFLVTSVLFASEHNRWLVGLIAGVVYNLLWYRTKSLGACIIAHGTTNLALGIYVLATRQWTFW